MVVTLCYWTGKVLLPGLLNAKLLVVREIHSGGRGKEATSGLCHSCLTLCQSCVVGIVSGKRSRSVQTQVCFCSDRIGDKIDRILFENESKATPSMVNLCGLVFSYVDIHW